MRRLAITVAMMLSLALGWGGPGHSTRVALAAGAPGAPAAPPTSTGSLDVVVAARGRAADGLTTNTQLRTVTIGPTDVRVVPLATISHPPSAVVRGELLQRAGRLEGVAVIFDERAGAGNAAYGSALSFVDRGGSVRRLATSVSAGSRPLVADDGLVYIQRGTPGGFAPTGPAGAWRIDSLEIDAVDPVSGSLRVVMTWQGYVTHLAGASGVDLIVYRVGPAGAELVLVNRTTGKTRVVTAVAPFARDFSVDAMRNAVVLANRDASDDSRWVIERIDLNSGARSELLATRDDSSTPFALADGSVWWTAPGRAGLASDRDAARVLAPIGAGYTYVTHASGDGAWLALAHVPNDPGFDVAAIYRPRTDRVVRLGSSSERVDVVGIVGAQPGALR